MKAKLRQHYRTVREGLNAEEVAAASRAICDRLTAWAPLRSAAAVLTYIAFRNELDLSALVTALPEIEWVVPRVHGQELVLHIYRPDRLVRHHFGMLEPAADLPTVHPSAVSLVLVPGVAFDRRGGRLGFGAGYYDRLLPRTTALRVGVTYDRCLADALPLDPHDQLVDWIVTPTQTIACTPGATPSSA